MNIPGGAPGIQGQRRYVPGNWVHLEMTDPLLPTAVYSQGLRAGLVWVHFQLSHHGGNIFQRPVAGEMPVQRLRLVLGGEWGFRDVQHAGGLEVLQRP
ncbi:hypothetical protein EYF80_030749 [Liparis tanakae]|uniref:Uncharacterized protein n=1 Tax=Liparis tanakae TaxID=230148 RepID=A0A4Z2H086_9TELE|nr:hypothetical protein EYF80_030749 [Liparis tanakae]